MSFGLIFSTLEKVQSSLNMNRIKMESQAIFQAKTFPSELSFCLPSLGVNPVMFLDALTNCDSNPTLSALVISHIKLCLIIIIVV